MDEILVKKLADQFGTPLFIMQEKGILDRFHALEAAIKKRYAHSRLAISYKTNLIHGLLALLHQAGADAEVVSGDEYRVAKKLCHAKQKIIFNGPMKLQDELMQAIQDGALINCDHLDEVNRVEQLAKNLQQRVSIGLRIYFSDNQLNWNRFGFSIAQPSTLMLIQRISNSAHLHLAGLHVHIGTNIRDMQMFFQLGQRLNQFALELKQHLQIELEWLDVGGGLAGISPRVEEKRLTPHPLPDAEAYAEAIILPLKPYLSSLRKPATLFFEPGRTLFEAFGSLLTRVVGRRETEAEGISAYILDAGINTLATSYAYDFPLQFFSDAEPYQKTRLYGPTCNQQDQLHTPIKLPALKIGDPLLFHGVGSYCMAFSYSFIRLRPGVVLLRTNNEVTWLRKPETLDHLSTLEVVPQ